MGEKGERDGGEAFEDEGGRPMCVASGSQGKAKEEVGMFFGRIWGEDSLE